MRLGGRRQSENVEDRRGISPGVALGGGGIGVIVMALIAMFMGADQKTLMRMLGQAKQKRPAAQGKAPGKNDPARVFISQVLGTTEDIWAKQFADRVDMRYKAPKLVIFENQVTTACGPASSAVGPFYCPGDQQIYIDPGFFEDLKNRHNADGDFAQAYVIAHEVAHHVQNLLKFNSRVNQARRSGDKQLTNRESVRLELQADFLAGVWAHHAHKEWGVLEEGDIEEGINAANQIGDDTLQKQATGRVMPERFTHGTSKQRVRWFTAGLRSGDIAEAQRAMEIPYNDL